MNGLVQTTTHLVGPAISMDDKLVQRCMICGERIELSDLGAFAVGTWLKVSGGGYGYEPTHRVVGIADPTRDYCGQYVPTDCCIDLVED